MKRLLIYPGTKYGELTVRDEERQVGKRRMFLCKCDCGNEVVVRLDPSLERQRQVVLDSLQSDTHTVHNLVAQVSSSLLIQLHK